MVNELCWGMPSVRMGLRAINLTRKLKSLANLTAKPALLRPSPVPGFQIQVVCLARRLCRLSVF